MVFLTLALAASASAHAVPKNIIDDAVALNNCLDDAVVSVQESVGQLLNVVNEVQEVLNSNIAKAKACLAIGGDKPSASDLIQQATCLVNLVSSVQDDITTVGNNLKTSLNNLVEIPNLLVHCGIEGAQALKECVEDAIKSLQSSVNNLLNSINLIQALINTNVAELRKCQALGAGGTTIGQIQEATCILNLANSAKKDITNLINTLQTSIDNIIHPIRSLEECIKI